MSGHQFEAWCSVHDCPPTICWLRHNPHAKMNPDFLLKETQAEEAYWAKRNADENV